MSVRITAGNTSDRDTIRSVGRIALGAAPIGLRGTHPCHATNR